MLRYHIKIMDSGFSDQSNKSKGSLVCLKTYRLRSRLIESRAALSISISAVSICFSMSATLNLPTCLETSSFNNAFLSALTCLLWFWVSAGAFCMMSLNVFHSVLILWSWGLVPLWLVLINVSNALRSDSIFCLLF